MEQWIDLVQLIFSFGLIYSIALLPFSLFSTEEIQWNHAAIAAGSSIGVPLRPSPLTSIQRWIARTARRKEAPDDDADCDSLIVSKLTSYNREDNHKRDYPFQASEAGQARSRPDRRDDSGSVAQRLLGGRPVPSDRSFHARVL